MQSAYEWKPTLPNTIIKGWSITERILFRSWSRSLAVSLQVTWFINPAVGCHYFPPGLQSPSQPLRGLLPISLLNEQRHDGCEQFAWDCYRTASWLWFQPGPFCAWVQHANQSATELGYPKNNYGLPNVNSTCWRAIDVLLSTKINAWTTVAVHCVLFCRVTPYQRNTYCVCLRPSIRSSVCLSQVGVVGLLYG